MVEFDPSAENLLSILGASFDIAGATLLARALVFVQAAPLYFQRPAERNEFRIAFDVGDEIEHVGGGVPHATFGRELRHDQRSAARAALSLAKSSPA